MSKQKIISTLFVGALIFAVSPTGAVAADADAGAEKAALCLTCHGPGDKVQGVGTPIISGQYEDYLIYALKSYRSGDRSNPIMTGFVSTLSDRDIEDLAAFYSSMDSSLFTPVE